MSDYSRITTPPDGFAFDEGKHLYTYKRAPLISVTQSFVQSGVIDTTYFTEDAAARGSAKHKACLYLNQNDLDETDLHPEVAGTVHWYRVFMRETGFVPIPELCEVTTMHRDFLYGMTWDAIGFMGRVPWLVEIKTGVVLREVVLQTAAYASHPELLKAFPNLHRGHLKLFSDRVYRFREHINLSKDFNMFLSVLNTARWRMEGSNKIQEG